MAVPNTNTFKLSDVTTDIGMTFPKGLAKAFTNANNSGFDSSYEGSAFTGDYHNRLSNFRNYSYTLSLTEFYAGSQQLSSSNACGTAATIKWHHAGASSNPVVGDSVYTTSAGTTVMSNGYYKKGFSQRYQVTSGQISSIANCY